MSIGEPQFNERAERHRRELHVHSYRMLELRLEEGALFCLARLPVASVRNVGSGVAVLAALDH